MKPSIIVAAAILLILGFAAGYFPEHEKFVRASNDLSAADKELVDVRGRLRLALMKKPLRETLWRAEAKNYEAAEKTLGDFYMEVRANLARPDMKKFQADLQRILDKQDRLFRELRDKEPAFLDSLRAMQAEMDGFIQPPGPSNLPAVLTRPPEIQN